MACAAYREDCPDILCDSSDVAYRDDVIAQFGDCLEEACDAARDCQILVIADICLL